MTTEWMSKEEIDEKTERNDSWRVEPEMVSMHKVQNGYFLREGDVVYVDNWDDFQEVSNNLHSDERYDLPEDHKDRALALVPIRCHKKRHEDEPDDLRGTHLMAVSNKNARNFSRLLMDGEMGDPFTTKGETWLEKESEDEDDDEPEFECPFCGKGYEMESYFRDHVKECAEDGN